MKQFFATLVLSAAITPFASASVITTYANDEVGFNTAIGGAATTVETFGPNYHFPISTGVLNSTTNGVSGISAGLIQPGVTYSTNLGSGNFFNIDCCSLGGPGAGSPFLDTVTGVGPLTVTFDNATNAFGFWQQGYMGNVLHITINFSSGPSYVDTVVLPGDNDFIGFISDSGITSAVISGDNSSFTFAIDNFTFVTTPVVTAVPEPGSIILLALGIALLGFMRRKQAA